MSSAHEQPLLTPSHVWDSSAHGSEVDEKHKQQPFHLASIHNQVLDEMHHNKLGSPYVYQADIELVSSLNVSSTPENWSHNHHSSQTYSPSSTAQSLVLQSSRSFQ